MKNSDKKTSIVADKAISTEIKLNTIANEVVDIDKK